jgi:signal transduction histidine kinase
MTDSSSMVVRPLGSLPAWPVDARGLRERLRLTTMSIGYVVMSVPAWVLAILSILCVPLGLVIVGFLLAGLVVPATGAVTAAHRAMSGALLGQTIPTNYADTTGTNIITRPVRWLRDNARWRDVGFLWFSATGGLVLSVLPAAFVAAPITHLTGAVIDGGMFWWLLVSLSAPLLLVWWLTTPALVRARARAERHILGGSLMAEMEHRVEQVAASRDATVDHNAAEIRRIERDLHDGAQARIVAVGMNVGLAETLVHTDPDTASMLLREARDTTVAALEELRSVVRGIHPPALADRGLVGALEALAVQLPLPITVALHVPDAPPEPVQSAVYFAVAECLTNSVKHAAASRGWITGSHANGMLRIDIGDDGRGGADPTGTGLTGVARRIAAFDGTMAIMSPPGGPTIVTLEVPCRTRR